MKALLPQFKTISVDGIDIDNTLHLLEKPLADVALKTYFSSEHQKIVLFRRESRCSSVWGFRSCRIWVVLATHCSTNNKTVEFCCCRITVSSSDIQGSFLQKLQSCGIADLTDDFYSCGGFNTPMRCVGGVDYHTSLLFELCLKIYHVQTFMIADKPSISPQYPKN